MRKFTLIILLLIAHHTYARQIDVVATVNENTIGTEETVTYTIEIQGASSSAIRTPSPPEATGLTLARSTPSTQSSVSIVNGVMAQSFAYRWVYRPDGEGGARIGSTNVTVSGQTYRTDPINVTVVPQSQRPARQPTSQRLDPFAPLFRSPFDTPEPESIPRPSENDLFIRAIPSATSVVQNQQVTIEYQLFFREGIQLRQSRLTDSWDAEGFWREELEVETRPIPQIIVEDGLRYNKIILKRAAVFPTRTGSLVVDSLRIESEAVLPGRGLQPLFSLQNRFQPVELASPSVTIESRPLPDGAPASFSGAVGRFTMDVTVDRTNVEVGSSIQVIARIRGAGNLATLAAPAYTPPAAFELYDPQISTNLDRSGTGLSGTKTFTFVLVPRANGTFDLPGIEFSYFDPVAGEYRSERSNPVSVLATGAPTTPETVRATTNGLPVDDVADSYDDPGHWTSASSRPVHRRTWPYLALIAPLLILGVAWIYQRHQTRLAVDVGYARGRRAHPLAKRHLTSAQTLMNENKASPFFGEIDRAVLGFVGNLLNISEKGLTRAQLDVALRKAGVEDEFRRRLTRLLEQCDRGRFAPATMTQDHLSAAYEEAAALIVLADATIGRNR